MINREAKSINKIFGKRLVKAAEPDIFWARPNEYMGLELEVEDWMGGDGNERIAEYWNIKGDGSLRNGQEFVLDHPMGGAELKNAIDVLWNGKFRYSMSERTSTHIHINMSDGLDIENFRSMFVMMYLIEPAVFRWTDENRKWCSYCCPLTDMSMLRIANFLNAEDDESFIRAVKGVTHEDKYYGFNMVSFSKHGTVEFRYFPCTKDKQSVINWVQFAMEVKTVALSYVNAVELLADVPRNQQDLMRWLRNKFPRSADNLIHNLDLFDCIQRIKSIEAIMQVPIKDFTNLGGRVKTVSSKGFKLLLEKKFNYNEAAPRNIEDVPVEAAGNLGARRAQYDYWNKLVQMTNDEVIKAQLIEIRNQFA